MAECNFLILETSKTNSTKFQRDETLKRAFARSLEIIGEAVRNLSPEFRNANPTVDWKRISGMRDRLIHDYAGVDYDLVWEAAKSRIPALKTAIKKILK